MKDPQPQESESFTAKLAFSRENAELAPKKGPILGKQVKCKG